MLAGIQSFVYNQSDVLNLCLARIMNMHNGSRLQLEYLFLHFCDTYTSILSSFKSPSCLLSYLFFSIRICLATFLLSFMSISACNFRLLFRLPFSLLFCLPLCLRSCLFVHLYVFFFYLFVFIFLLCSPLCLH